MTAHAETKSSGLEESLADLHREALFLPRSTLSGLKDIGQGKMTLLTTNACLCD